MRKLLLAALGAAAVLSAEGALTARAGKYEVTLRLPAGGLLPREEMQLEFRIADTAREDPVLGAAPVVRALVRGSIDMPAMPGMAKFEDIAHPEGVAGEYGLHPTFAHGGEYRLRLAVTPPDDAAFEVEFTLPVADAAPPRKGPAVQPFRVEVAASPKNPRAGEPVDLTVRIRREPSKELVTAFDRVHEEFLHLIIVRSDLGEFSHQHPAQQADGSFALRHTFPGAGEYHLFADTAPRGAGGQVLLAKIKISGKAPPRFSLRAGEGRAAADGMTVALDGAKFPARKTVTLRAAVTAEGSAITDLQPYLGAMGHFILIHQDGETFVHSHPDERIPGAGRDGVVPFLVRFPKEGLYRGWIQLQRGGKVSTFAFVVEAGE
jgi:hypothetical protein